LISEGDGAIMDRIEHYWCSKGQNLLLQEGRARALGSAVLRQNR